MKQLTALMIFILSCFFAAAQTPAQITGKITENSNKPLPAATVSLLKAKDSSLVKTAITNSSGIFKMLAVKPGSYFLSATSVGHMKNSSAKFDITEGQEFTSSTLILSQGITSLSAVTVQAKKPMIEVKADKTVFNVENSINATGRDRKSTRLNSSHDQIS